MAFHNFGERKRRHGQRDEFSRILDTTIHKGAYRSFDHYTLNGEVVVDAFIRQESLREDLMNIVDKIGIAVPEPLPQLKSDFRTDSRSAHEILTPEQKRIVFQTCREEFDLHGYSQ